MKNTIFPGREQPYIICVDDEQAILNQLSAQLEDAFGDLCIIEEGKMNLTVSLLIRYQGNIGKYHEKLENWLKHQIFL